jgi:hypothetical protein
MYQPLGLPVSMVLFLCTLFLLESSALANVPIAWAIYGGNASLCAGLLSKGFSFIAVILIEFITFYRYFQLQWRKALVTALVVNIISTVAGVLITLPFIIPGTMIFSFPIVIGVIISRINCPKKYAIVAFPIIVIGSIGAFLNFIIMPPQPYIRIFMALLLPLFLGFGITVMIEGAAIKLLLKDIHFEKIWQVIFLVNIFSYLFLISMLPLFPNPYNPERVWRQVQSMIETGHQEGEIIAILHHMQASNLFLLGVTEDDSPYQKDYEPYIERMLINKFRESNRHFQYLS